MPKAGATNDVSNARAEVHERVLHKEVTVGSSTEKVWWAWTTSDGMASWWAKQSWIDLRIDGPFELYFLLDRPRGSQGAESCRILSYLPQEMFSFSWNFPPEIPEIRFDHTWVVLRFQRISPSETRVIFDQLGWKTGPAWEAGWKYFDAAWGEVLERLRTVLPKVDDAGRKS